MLDVLLNSRYRAVATQEGRSRHARSLREPHGDVGRMTRTKNGEHQLSTQDNDTP